MLLIVCVGYVLYLEQEVQRLKRECRQMAENQERRQPLGLHQPSQALRDRVMNVLKQEGNQPHICMHTLTYIHTIGSLYHSFFS